MTGKTAQEWLSLLETSYIIFRLPPWFSNIGKRLTKASKLYFYDVGLAAWLMGITQQSHLPSHPLRGNLFENLAVLEVLKTLHNAGQKPNLHFYRDSSHQEVDLVLEQGADLRLMEIKSAQTVAADALRPAMKVRQVLGEKVLDVALLYGGDEYQRRTDFEVLPYTQIQPWLQGVLQAGAA